MDIKLVKMETFDVKVNEEKCKSFDFNDIMFLANAEYKYADGENPKYVYFKTRDEFLENMNKYDIDTTKKVLVDNKGNFFCALKSSATITESKENTNESTNSEENQTEQA